MRSDKGIGMIPKQNTSEAGTSKEKDVKQGVQRINKNKGEDGTQEEGNKVNLVMEVSCEPWQSEGQGRSGGCHCYLPYA